MSKFSKRAKFLSILAAASAVGGTGAGAMNKSKNTASVGAQNAVKYEGNLGLNTRNNLRVTKGPRFSIEPKSAFIGGAAAGGAVGLAWLLTHLFSGNNSSEQDKYTKECLDYLIETLKKNKIVGIKVKSKYSELRVEFLDREGNSLSLPKMIEKIGEFESTDKLDKTQLDAANLRNRRKKFEIIQKLDIGRQAFINNIMETFGDDLVVVGFVNDKYKLSKDKDGNILLDGHSLEEEKKYIQEDTVKGIAKIYRKANKRKQIKKQKKKS
ncbi:MAG: hypothetical protein J6P21_03835 [Clostridia bacterium]|nr:hypothetical protein [Clostridia bacterium]